MGKSTISMAIFNSKLLVYQRVAHYIRRFCAPSPYHRHVSMRPDPSPCAAAASAQGAELPWSSGSNPSGRCRSHSWDGHLKHFLRKMMGNAKGIKNGLHSCLFQCYVLKFQFDFMGLTGNRMSSIGLSPNLRNSMVICPKITRRLGKSWVFLGIDPEIMMGWRT